MTALAELAPLVTERPVRARGRARWTRGIVPLGLVATAAYAVTGAFGVDTWYALYTGRVVAQGGPPHHEVLTTAGTPDWTDQQWLGQWLFYETYRIGSYAGVALLCIASLALTGLLLSRLLERRGAPTPTIWAAGAVVAIGFATALVRTQTLALPLFIALLVVLTSALRDERWRPTWLLTVPILAVWANLHGSVLLGVTLTIGCLALQAIRLARHGRHQDATAAVGVAILSVGTTVATPYGLSTVHYYVSLMNNSALRNYISDWQATDLTNVSVWPFLALVVAGALTIVAELRKRHPDRVWRLEVAMAFASAVLGFYAARYIVWAVIVLAYAAAVHGAGRTIEWRGATVARVVGGGVLAVCVGSLATIPATELTRPMPTRLASAAASTLATHPGSVLLADQTTSAAALWLHEETTGRVAFDIRYEQYDAKDITAYLRYLNNHNPSLGCRYGVVAVSSKERPDLVTTIRSDPAWRTTYDRADGVVAVRSDRAPCTVSSTERAS